MGELIGLSEDELTALEQLILGTCSSPILMNNLAGRGLVWRTGGDWTLSQAGWRAIRGHRWGLAHDHAGPIFHQF